MQQQERNATDSVPTTGTVDSSRVAESTHAQPEPYRSKGDCGCSEFELCIDKPNCKRPPKGIVTEACMWCGDPATRLCDAPIGFAAIGAMRDEAFNVTGLLTGSREDGSIQMWTCDAEMCDCHATRVGFICGKAADSIDRCPFHAGMEAEPMERLIMFAPEAETKRREVHAVIRRARMSGGSP